ncbi:M15 family metallopeptidase [Lysinibacter sp. HNR]|uniref:M15 family metallopeptidase n=1 Tax=Lysinibacter sp. HNR TaxID=3031408 RepID=UPI0024352FD5|nr:M15 family metallopeptidase [Lysinibacter sp. HNR]WGD37163.1 M15 family metallopeptidase [Lysinibacter sp. HNR]
MSSALTALKRFRTATLITTALATITLITACAEPKSPQDPGVLSTSAPAVTPAPTEAPAFDITKKSIDDPTSLWVISNKTRPLTPIDFAPSDTSMPEGIPNEFSQPLREPASRALEQLYADATEAGLELRITSAYRDYATQENLYNIYTSRDGQEAADTYSARPGYSEHQTGLAVDLDDSGGCYVKACFADTPAGIWLAENAPNYGFILRYPQGKESITGFTFEPWHFRYVGPELAQEMKRTDVATMEEFFDLPPAPSYK